LFILLLLSSVTLATNVLQGLRSAGAVQRSFQTSTKVVGKTNSYKPQARIAQLPSVIGCLSVHYIQSLKSFFYMWLKSFSGIRLQLQFFYAINAILLVL